MDTKDRSINQQSTQVGEVRGQSVDDSLDEGCVDVGEFVDEYSAIRQ